ncbi:MAG: molybdate ABC transporter substrate-binding protein [Candidatus Acidiferrales bacterium]
MNRSVNEMRHDNQRPNWLRRWVGNRRQRRRIDTGEHGYLLRRNSSSLGNFFVAAVLAAFIALVTPALAGVSKTDLTISAAISLQNALQDIARLYHTANPNVNVRLNLGASGTLQRQIEQGAPVDLFLSAAESEMDGVESKGLILRDTRKNLLTNSVVLIVPKGRTDIRHFQDLAKPDVKVIAIGNPQSVPAGKYAQQLLTHFGLYGNLTPKFVLAKDVRAVLTYVETGNADAGIVYETDAMTTNQVTVVATAPPGSHEPVVYPIAVLAHSRNTAAAKAFEAFLLRPESADVFRKHGFHPVAH